MLVGLISDTHLTDPESDLHPQIYRDFAHVDLILHAGDIYAPWVLDRLETLAPVLGIQAYPDPPDPRLERTRIIRIEDMVLGLIHNIGFPETPIDVDRGLILPREPHIQQILKKKFGEELDIVVFGDTHEELVEQQQGVLFINPGSPLYPGMKHELGSPGTISLLEISGRRARARLIQLEDDRMGQNRGRA
jgi:putative phosphoesterase